MASVASYLAGQATDAQTGMESSKFVKSGSGKYLTALVLKARD